MLTLPMSTTNSKDLPQPSIHQELRSTLPRQTVFGDENGFGVVDWIFGAVGGKVHLGDTGDTSIWGGQGDG